MNTPDHEPTHLFEDPRTIINGCVGCGEALPHLKRLLQKQTFPRTLRRKNKVRLRSGNLAGRETSPL